MSDEKPGKKRQLVFRCTEEEYQRIAKAAKFVRRTPSDFMRIALEDACNYILKKDSIRTKPGKPPLMDTDREASTRQAFWGDLDT